MFGGEASSPPPPLARALHLSALFRERIKEKIRKLKMMHSPEEVCPAEKLAFSGKTLFYQSVLTVPAFNTFRMPCSFFHLQKESVQDRGIATSAHHHPHGWKTVYIFWWLSATESFTKIALVVVLKGSHFFFLLLIQNSINLKWQIFKADIL